MKRVVFFIQPDWAFGVIHQELAKYLFPYAIDCKILPWNISYTIEEMLELNNTTDLFVTTPHGWRFLGHNYKTVSPEKCIIVSHAKVDIAELLHYHGAEEFLKFKEYACVSNWLINVSKELGIERNAKMLPLGLNHSSFQTPVSDSLRVVGYAGFFHQKEDFTEQQIKDKLALPKYHKRAWLVKQATEMAGLHFKAAATYHNSFVTMPGFYKSVDAVISASTEEGAGLPIMEAGAAGRLVITTPVGHYPERIMNPGADVVPIDETEFLEKTIELLSYYKCNPEKYRQRCLEIQHHAITYDWKYVIDKWVELLK